MVLIIESKIIVINLGDSWVIGYSSQNQSVTQITVDHKPENLDEQKRIFNLGGYLYKSNTQLFKYKSKDFIEGTLRIYPGRLSITRAIGDHYVKV